MQQKKKQITARIPEDLYYRCNALYPNVTDAVIAGLELLCNADRNADCNASEVNCNADCNAGEAACNADCNADRNANKILIINLQTQIKDLENKLSQAPDPIELAKVQAHFEGLKLLLEERDKRIDEIKQEKDARIQELTREINRIDYHSMKNSETKQIEAPAAEKVKPWWRFW